MSVDVGTARGFLDLDINGFLNGLRTAQSEAEKSSKNLAEKIGGGLQSAGKSMKSAGKTLTAAVTTPVIGLGGMIIKTSADFQSAMSEVQAISGASGKSFDDLTAKAREMGAKTKFSASESAEAFKYMAMAGWSTEQMMGGISGVMNLAAASGEELGAVSDIVTDAMTAFGMSAADTSKVMKDGLQVEVDNTTRFVDVLAAASNKSNTNVAMLGESFKYVAPVAGALGYSVEDTAVALGLMANNGIKSSQAGTALRGILTRMAKPTKESESAMNALGLSLTDDEGKMKSLMDVMKDLREGFKGGTMSSDEFQKKMLELDAGLNSGKIKAKDYERGVMELCTQMYGAEGAEKAQLAAMLAGQEGMSGLLAIVNTTEEDFNKLTEGIYNANGTSQEMADIMNNNVNGQLTILKSMLEELALQFGEILLPKMKDFVDWLQKIVAKLQEMSPEQREQIVKWAAIAAAIGPCLLVFGKLIVGVGNVITTLGKIPAMIEKVKTGFGLLQAAIGGISAPVVAVVAIIGVLVAAFMHLWNTNENFRAKITEIWNGIKAKFEEFGQAIVDRLNALGFDFDNFTQVVKGIWDGFCNLLAPIFEGVFQQISNIIGVVLDVIIGILDVFIGIFTGNWEQVWTGIKEIFGGIWDFIVATFENYLNVFKGIADTVLGWFGTNWETVWTAIKTFFSNIWDGIVSFFTTVLTAIQTVATTVWTAVYNFISNILNNIRDFVSKIWNTISSAISTVLTTIWTTIQTVWNNILYAITLVIVAIQNVIQNIFGAIKDFLSGNSEAAKEKLREAWTTIKNLITELVNVIRSTISTVFEAIKTIISTIMNAISTVFSTVWNAIKTVVSNVVNGIKTTVSTVFEAMKTAVTNTINALKTSVTNIFEGIKTAMSDAVSKAKQLVVDKITEAKDGVVNVWNGIKDTFAGIGKNIIQGIIDGIGGMLSSLYDKIKEGLSGLVDKAKNALGIKSPSKVFAQQIGRWLPPGIAQGFTNAVGEATKSMRKDIDGMTEQLGESKADVKVGVGFAAIGDDVKFMFDSMLEYFVSIEARLAYVVSSMRDNLEYLIYAGQMAALAASGAQIAYVGYNGGKIPVDDGRGPKWTPQGGQNAPGGNTYVFYTTKPIDEIEAARQMRRTERDIAEGF